MKGKKLITTICIICVLATLLCIPAFATVTETSGDGYALYNGKKLPIVDGLESLEEFPYFGIAYIVSDDQYGLLFSDSPVSVVRDTGALVMVGGGTTAMYLLEDNEWGYFWFGSGSWQPNETLSYVDYFSYVYSNYDVYYTDSATLYFASSTPIPLDGYNVIEWDGDTTGLIQIDDNVYKLAPYEFAVDAFAVWNGDTRSVQTTYLAQSPLWAIQACGATGVVNGDVVVIGDDGTSLDGFVLDGIAAYITSSGYYPSLIAYRTTETPPDEGGGDDDDPQPPSGG